MAQFHVFQNIDKIGSVTCPVLVIHVSDTIIWLLALLWLWVWLL